MTRAVVWVLVLGFLVLSSLAQEKLPALRPPLGEIPPSFWEQQGTTVIVCIVGALLVSAVGIWLWWRPRPVEVLPPEVQAQNALEALLPKPEDGTVVSRASQILRHYVLAVFELPTGEPTTSEFCHLIAGHERVGPGLSDALASFLRQCDERKFAQSNASTPLGAVARALELVAQGEARRAQLSQSEPTHTAQPAAAST